MLDWEFAHAGSPWTDLGNAVRFDRHPAWVEAVVAAYDDPDALDLARRADLWALVELASRRGHNPVADAAHDLLRAIAAARDVHADGSRAEPSGRPPGCDYLMRRIGSPVICAVHVVVSLTPPGKETCSRNQHPPGL